MPHCKGIGWRLISLHFMLFDLSGLVYCFLGCVANASESGLDGTYNNGGTSECTNNKSPPRIKWCFLDGKQDNKGNSDNEQDPSS